VVHIRSVQAYSAHQTWPRTDKQARERGFAGPGRSDDAERLAGRERETHAGQNHAHGSRRAETRSGHIDPAFGCRKTHALVAPRRVAEKVLNTTPREAYIHDVLPGRDDGLDRSERT